MTLQQEVEALGLSKNESKVYLATLQLGEPTVGEIEKHAELHKQLVYNAATSLQKKGLISIHEVRGRKRFSVPNPAALEELARIQLEQTQTLVPQLLEMANKNRDADTVRTYRGQKATQQYYLASIRKQPKLSKIEILGIDSERYFDLLPQDSTAYQRFEKARVTKQVKMKLLLFGKHEKEQAMNANRKFFELRTPASQLHAPMDIMIWHDHVGMLFYAEEPYVLDIIGQTTVEGFSQYFAAFWEQTSGR